MTLESIKRQPEIVSFEDSCTQAKGILERYRRQINEAHHQSPDPGVNAFNPDRAIEFFLQQFPREVQEEFFGHGIVKGNEIQQLGALLNILSNKIMKGDSGRLIQGARTFIPAYTRAPFLVLSHYKQNLAIRGESRRLPNGSGVAVNPGAYVVNGPYYPIVEELRSTFPKENIIRANELPNYVQLEINSGETAF